MSLTRLVFLKVTLFALLSITGACSLNIKTNDNDDSIGFQPATIIKAKQSNLYVYRPTTMTNGLYSTEISVDDEHIFMVKLGQLKHLKVPAGQHQIKLETDSNIIGNQQIDISMEAGKSYYFSITTSLKMDNSTGFKPYRRQFDIQQMTDVSAIKEINNCCYSRQQTQKTPEKEIVTKDHSISENEDATFSVDKTSNPFSH